MNLQKLVEEVRENGLSWSWWKNAAVPYGIGRLYLYWQELIELEKVDVMEEDWDNLIILDACRFDMFSDNVELGGQLSSRYSKGSATPEFVRNNFLGESYRDTIYITANPYVDLIAGESFYKTVSLWESDWDADLGTVKPDVVAEAVRRTHEKYPQKRLIVHFMQPHYPFIGEFGQSEIQEHAGYEKSRGEAQSESIEREEATIWEMAKDGVVSIESVKSAYIENLDIVLPHVSEVTEILSGKSIVTSDHGNLLGERPFPIPVRMYGHPERVPVKPLIQVPWLELPFDSRREIVDGKITQKSEDHETDVQSRLEDLGYLE